MPLAEHIAGTELACRRLLQRYVRSVDTQDWSSLESIFATDVSFIRNGQPPLPTIGAIRDFFSQLVAARAAKGELHYTQHHLTTVSVTALDESRAESIAYVLVLRDIRLGREIHKEAVPVPVRTMAQPELLLEYRDCFVLERGEWRIRRHEVQQLFRAARAAAPP
jgi:hypothetical protein